MYKFGKTSLRRLNGVHPFLAAVCHEALGVCDVDFSVVDGVRTVERQREYYQAGTSQTLDSYHLYGLAVDLVPYIGGKLEWDDDDGYKAIAEAMNFVSRKHRWEFIRNGFEMWGWDKPHWQMNNRKGLYDVRKLR